MPFGLGTLIVNTHTAPTLSNDPLTDSLYGEYARMLLVATAGCSAIASVVRIGLDPIAAILVVGNILILASLVTSRLAGIMRCLLLMGFALTISWATRQSSGENAWWSPVVFFSPAVLLASLLMLAARDFVTALRRHSDSRYPAGLRSYRVWGFAIGVVALLVYMVIVPSVDSFLEQFRERPNSYAIEELTVFEQLRIRTAKFAVFAVFAYFGACVGSFLNVVAASAPRGESITLRSSSCPQCQTPIRRIDNLPIVSYLNLGGRCRSCGVGIPIRYLAVEIVVMTIFAALFLYELVTGAANVPEFAQYHYAGILWIILYTKWPVIGIYFYHCALLSCLLMLALMEADRLRCPRWMAATLVATFLAIAIASPTILPVSLVDQIPVRLPEVIPPWGQRLMTCIAGAAMGWLVSTAATRARTRSQQWTSSTLLAAILIGIALGWQATLTIGVLWLLVATILKYTGGQSLRPRWLTPTMLLFAATMLHHPVWKWLAQHW